MDWQRGQGITFTGLSRKHPPALPAPPIALPGDCWSPADIAESTDPAAWCIRSAASSSSWQWFIVKCILITIFCSQYAFSNNYFLSCPDSFAFSTWWSVLHSLHSLQHATPACTQSTVSGTNHKFHEEERIIKHCEGISVLFLIHTYRVKYRDAWYQMIWVLNKREIELINCYSLQETSEVTQSRNTEEYYSEHRIFQYQLLESIGRKRRQ